MDKLEELKEQVKSIDTTSKYKKDWLKEKGWGFKDTEF